MKFPRWVPKSIGFSWTWALNYPDAGGDICLWPGCGKMRRNHTRDDGHSFVEKE